MKRNPFIPLLSILAATGIAAGAEGGGDIVLPDEVVAASEQIRAVDAQAMVEFLASQHLEGRGAATRGERIAAEYIVSELKSAGVKPGGKEGAWLQTFRLIEMELGEGNDFSVLVARGAAGGTRRAQEPTGSAGVRRTYELESGFLPFNFSRTGTLTDVPVVFAGYGITAPEYGYDDYAGLDVRGKAVLVLRHEPGELDASSKFRGVRMTPHASLIWKARNASAHGAAAMLLVTDPVHHDPEDRAPGNRLAYWSSLVERSEYDKRPQPDPTRKIEGWDRGIDLLALHVSGEAAADISRAAGVDLSELQKTIDSTGRPASRRLDGPLVSATVSITTERKTARNVLGMVEGSDPELKDEVVILGGHYDHVGWGHYGSMTGSWDRIHAGADDNASGTAGVILAARAFASLPTPPRRSVMFILFTGEEMGLLGSRRYVEKPVVPLERTAAMFNMDMVGRNDPNILTLVSDTRGRKLDDLVREVNRLTAGMTVNRDFGGGIERSDQAYFGRKGVPAVAFFSGIHDDYHRPSDTAGKIVPEKIEKIARLAFSSAWVVADRPGIDLRMPEADQGTDAANGAVRKGGRPR